MNLVYVSDPRGGGQGALDWATAHGGPGVKTVLVGQTEADGVPGQPASTFAPQVSMRMLVQSIFTAIDCQMGSIGKLLLQAHGSPGHIALGSGLGVGPGDWSVAELGTLRPAMAPRIARVILCACSCGADRLIGRNADGGDVGAFRSDDRVEKARGDNLIRHGRGYLLAVAIARALDAEVTAPFDRQHSFNNWSLNGPRMVVKPDGRVTIIDVGVLGTSVLDKFRGHGQMSADQIAGRVERRVPGLTRPEDLYDPLHR